MVLDIHSFQIVIVWGAASGNEGGGVLSQGAGLQPVRRLPRLAARASTIDWLKVKLQEQGFGYRTISGSMTLKQRSKVCSITGPSTLPLHILQRRQRDVCC